MTLTRKQLRSNLKKAVRKQAYEQQKAINDAYEKRRRALNAWKYKWMRRVFDRLKLIRDANKDPEDNYRRRFLYKNYRVFK